VDVSSGSKCHSGRNVGGRNVKAPSKRSFCMSTSMLQVPVYAACLCLYCMPMSLLYIYPCPCCMSMSALHGLGQAAWTSTCSRTSMYMLLVTICVYAAWTWPCSMDKHVHAAFPSSRPCYTSTVCPYCIFMSMLHVPVHAGCLCLCSMDMDMQHGHAHAAWTWARSMDMDTQHGRGHAAWPWACSMDMDTQHVLGHAAWTWTGGRDMDK
jgi:hypothetical protein